MSERGGFGERPPKMEHTCGTKAPRTREDDMTEPMQRRMTEGDGETANREIVMTRIFNAPRAVVFSAFTEAEHFPNWFGPRGFTITLLEMDVRPGGRARYIMHGPDGVDYPNRTDYEEVIRPARLVYVHGSGEDADPHRFHVTIDFVEERGGTRVTMRSVFPSVAALERVVSFGAIELGHQTFDKLAEYLGS
jgi:uncharacterized protein YndB with AHSA1/START domain